MVLESLSLAVRKVVGVDKQMDGAKNRPITEENLPEAAKDFHPS